jgi:hypothetical protein
VAGKLRRPFVLQGIEEISSRFTVSSNLESVDQSEADTSHYKNLASTTRLLFLKIGRVEVNKYFSNFVVGIIFIVQIINNLNIKYKRVFIKFT